MAQKATVDLAGMSAKKYVTGGPHLWVSCLLQEKGVISTNRIWEEYLRDQNTPKQLIPTKNFLKDVILF